MLMRLCAIILSVCLGAAMFSGCEDFEDVEVDNTEISSETDGGSEPTDYLDKDAPDASEDSINTTDVFPGVSKVYDVTPSGKRLTFSGTDIYGNAIDSSIFADYDLTLINFWEPWCPGCVAEMPEFENAYETAAAEGVSFNVIGFYSDSEDALSTVEELGITYPVVNNDTLLSDFYTGYVPVNVFVNSEGYVLPITSDEFKAVTRAIFESYGGDISDDEIQEYMEDMIYSEGQTLNISAEYLYPYIADRLN